MINDTLGNYTGSEYKIDFLKEPSHTTPAKPFPIHQESVEIEAKWSIKIGVFKCKNVGSFNFYDS